MRTQYKDSNNYGDLQANVNADIRTWTDNSAGRWFYFILSNEISCQEEEEYKEDKVEVVRSVLRTCYRNFQQWNKYLFKKSNKVNFWKFYICQFLHTKKPPCMTKLKQACCFQKWHIQRKMSNSSKVLEHKNFYLSTCPTRGNIGEQRDQENLSQVAF